MIDTLKQQIQDLNNYSGRGSNSRCYCIGEYALLYGSIELETVTLKKALIEKYIADGIQIAPILEYQVDPNAKISSYGEGENKRSYQDGWTLQQRAVGSEIYKSWHRNTDISSLENIESQFTDYLNNLNDYTTTLKKFANIPQEQLDRFIHGYLALATRAELMVDSSKPTNFFYDEQAGFTFIDLNMQSKNVNKEYLSPQWTANYIIMLLIPFLPSIEFYQENFRRQGVRDHVQGLMPTTTHNDITTSLNEILNKLRIGFANNNVDSVSVETEVSKRLESFEALRQLPQYSNEQELFGIIKQKLNTVVSTNLQNTNISGDEELRKSDGDVFKGIII